MAYLAILSTLFSWFFRYFCGKLIDFLESPKSMRWVGGVRCLGQSPKKSFSYPYPSGQTEKRIIFISFFQKKLQLTSEPLSKWTIWLFSLIPAMLTPTTFGRVSKNLGHPSKLAGSQARYQVPKQGTRYRVLRRGTCLGASRNQFR